MRKNVLDRFMDKVVVNSDTGCWEWQAAKNKKGYGMIGHYKKTILAHRFACEHWNGPKPTDKDQCSHKCNNPSCVNPDHLYWATVREDSDDRRRNGRLKGSNNSKAMLSESDIPVIRNLVADGANDQLIADKFGVSRATIYCVRVKRSWGHV